MPNDLDHALVIGGGIIGLCTAWALTDRGIHVTLVEKGPVPNPLSASFDEHRLIRYPYGRETGYSHMVDEAYAGWERLWAALGKRLYAETGILALSCRPGDWSHESRQALDQIGISYQIFSPAEMHERYPFLSPQGVRWALYHQRGGVLFAGQIIAALSENLEARGVELRTHSPVKAIDVNRRLVQLDSGERITARQIVVAAGAWTGTLLPAMASRLTPWRQVSVYLEPPPKLADDWLRSPAILDTGGDDEGYAVPPASGTRLKWAAGAYGRSGDPDGERTVHPDEMDGVLSYLKRSFVSADDYRLLEAQTCYFTRSDGERFIIDEIADRLWAVSGCSGHMFKFGPAVGLKLAETVTGQYLSPQLTAWAAGKLPTEI